MPYANSADIAGIYGQDELDRAADRDGDGTADDAVVTQALENATSTINSHVGRRYPLPLLETPPLLRRLCVDIALYNLVLEGGAWTEEHRYRYEDALKHLQRIGDGRATLGEGATPTEDTAPAARSYPLLRG